MGRFSGMRIFIDVLAKEVCVWSLDWKNNGGISDILVKWLNFAL